MIYRGYIISKNPHSPTLHKVAVEGRGGKIPAVLEGSFTSEGIVKGLIDTYLNEQEGKKRGKADTTE